MSDSLSSASSHAPIGLFYGSSTCYTEIVAEKIKSALGYDLVDLLNVAEHSLSEVEPYALLILGIPTWDYGELQEDWEAIWPELNDIDLQNKKVALFGLGDQIGYPEWFLDAMGYLHDQVVNQGATPVGYWPNQGYEFDDSKALTDDEAYFVGLALDDENEFDKTDARIATWCEQIKSEFGLN